MTYHQDSVDAGARSAADSARAAGASLNSLRTFEQRLVAVENRPSGGGSITFADLGNGYTDATGGSVTDLSNGYSTLT